MRQLSRPAVRATIGLVGLVLAVASVRLLLAWRLGAYDDDYRVTAVFERLGQPFPRDAEVNVRGVRVGEVVDLEVVDDGAQVAMEIREGFRLPADTRAVVRAKSLVGQRYVDLQFEPGATDQLLADGERIEHTVAGPAVLPILGDAHRVLEAVDPRDVATVFSTLGDAAAGQGETFGQALEDAEVLTDLFVDHEPQVRALFGNVAVLSDELERRADDIVGLSGALGDTAATLADHDDAFTDLLADSARLYGDVADLLEGNRQFLRTARTDGDQILDVVFDRREILVEGEKAALEGFADYLAGVAEFVEEPVPWRGPDAVAYREIYIFPQTICQMFPAAAFTGEGACSATGDLLAPVTGSDGEPGSGTGDDEPPPLVPGIPDLFQPPGPGGDGPSEDEGPSGGGLLDDLLGGGA